MRFIMKEKLFSWGDDYIIRDEQEQPVYQVQDKIFSLGKQLFFRDMAGNELAFIKQRLFAWGPTYEIYQDNVLAAVVSKELFTFFHCHFTVDVPGPDDLEAGGNFFDYEYTFTRGQQSVAQVSKQWFAWTDTYGVEIADDVDPLLVLASTVVIDQVCHEDRS